MERVLNIRCDIGNQLCMGWSLYYFGILIEKEGKISLVVDYYSCVFEMF